MNRSTPLSPDARRLLELGSHVEPPTSEQNDRMDRALATLFRAGRAPAGGSGSLGSLEPGAAMPEKSAIHRRPLPPPARRPLESVLGLNGGKLWLALGALAATASASFWLGRVSTPGTEAERDEAAVVASVSAPALLAPTLLGPPPQPARPAAATSLVPVVAPPMQPDTGAPEPTRPGDDAQRTEERASPEPNAVAIHASASAPRGGAPLAATRPGWRTTAPAQALDPLGLAAEIEQLAGAEAALRQGRAERALRLLEQRSVHHLLEQAAALRAIAECALGTVSAAAAARDVLARWPASAFQPRIIHACGL